MTFSTFASPGVGLQGGGGSGSGGTPGGATTQIQYNNAGAFAGASGLTTNGTNLTFGSASQLLWSTDLILTRRAAANLRLGAADTTGTTTPTAQTLSVQSWTSSTNNNQPGANFTIAGSQGTGTGAGGSIIFQVAPAGAVSNGVQNALATALTINSVRQLLAETSSDAAPAFAFSGATGTGLSVRGSVGRLVAAGTPIAEFTSGEFRLGGSQYFSWASNTSADPGAASDVRLYRDAANTLALRNGANAQTFNVYKTFDGTVGGNNSYFTITANTGTGGIDIGPAKSGTGANLSLFIGASNSTGGIYLRANGYGNTGWYFSGSGSSQALLYETDNAYDIGASGGSRPRHGYFGGNLVAGGSLGLQIGTGSAPIYWAGRSQVYSPANGNILLQNAAQSDFDRLQFGGTTSSFPALKRNSTALETKLADDSAYAPHAMQYLDVTDGITAPASATGRARIYVDTADGDLKVIFADGTVKTIVTDT